jgi:hypothetical protein
MRLWSTSKAVEAVVGNSSAAKHDRSPTGAVRERRPPNEAVQATLGVGPKRCLLFIDALTNISFALSRV